MPARLDRVLTLCMHRMLPWSMECLPILMYHSISDDAEASRHPYYRVATNPQRFTEQMQWLAELGCIGLSLEEALPLLASGKWNGRRAVAITFDDGFRDFQTAAWPVLRRHRFTATVYLPTGFISAQRRSFQGKECLTWNEVRELRAQGIRFGSHTVTHPRLYGMPWDQIERELALSKEQLEQNLGEAVASFAYPYAFPQEDQVFTLTLSALLRGRGYQTCVTTVIGRARTTDDRLKLKRLPTNSCDDRAFLCAKLAGAYDWLGPLQRLVRWLKPWRTMRSLRAGPAGQTELQACKP